VSHAESLDATDTIGITASLWKLFGCVLRAIDENTKPENQNEGSGPEKATRFLYCPKASTSERNAGLEGMPTKSTYVRDGANNPSPNRQLRDDNARQNTHPTVKPVKLMEYLCRLITPPGGIVLDPFMGSGTTGIAAKNLGLDFIGIELNAEYFEIASKRVGG